MATSLLPGGWPDSERPRASLRFLNELTTVYSPPTLYCNQRDGILSRVGHPSGSIWFRVTELCLLLLLLLLLLICRRDDSADTTDRKGKRPSFDRAQTDTHRWSKHATILPSITYPRLQSRLQTYFRPGSRLAYVPRHSTTVGPSVSQLSPSTHC